MYLFYYISINGQTICIVDNFTGKVVQIMLRQKQIKCNVLLKKITQNPSYFHKKYILDYTAK